MPFKRTNVDETEKAMAKVKGRRTWSPPAGEDGEFKKTRVRFLPPSSTHPGDDYRYWVPIHSGLPGARFGVVCPEKMHGEPCAACQKANQLQDAGKKDAARAFWPSWKAVVNIAVLKMNGSLPLDEDDEPLVKIVTWCVPKTLMEDLDAKLKSRNKKGRDITNVAAGYDVVVSRKGTKAQDTKYEIAPMEDPTPLHQAIIDAVDADESILGDLTNIYDEVTSEKMPALLIVQKPVAELGSGEPKRRRSAWEDEDEDEDDDDVIEGSVRVLPDDDDEDEAPPPPRTSRKREAAPKEERVTVARDKLQGRLAARKAAAEEDDDDDEDDE